jgi:hypothetical protein
MFASGFVFAAFSPPNSFAALEFLMEMKGGGAAKTYRRFSRLWCTCGWVQTLPKLGL